MRDWLDSYADLLGTNRSALLRTLIDNERRTGSLSRKDPAPPRPALLPVVQGVREAPANLRADCPFCEGTHQHGHGTGPVLSDCSPGGTYWVIDPELLPDRVQPGA